MEIVRLQDAGKKKTASFSLGMKQRLGIAIALLNNPSLLILDEPTNGLDPNGIIEIRELLKTLNKERGTTIVISSHLLPEIEKLATHLGIIHRGRLVFQGTLAQLQEQQDQGSQVTFATDDPGKTAELLAAEGLSARASGDMVSIPLVAREVVAALNRKLVDSGVAVYQVGVVKDDLESIFMELVKGESLYL